MFSQKTLDFISALHKSNVRVCLITAGAGSTAVSALMSVPGCSKTLLDAQTPYSVASTIELLDSYPNSYVSPAVAANLSHTAFARAQKLAACPCNPPNALHGHMNNFATNQNDNTAAIRQAVPLGNNNCVSGATPVTTVHDERPSHEAVSNSSSLAAFHSNSNNNNNNGNNNVRLVGLGATAAISTVPDRRGEDRVHACCRTEEGVHFRSLTMTKGLERHIQEWMVSCVLLQLLADVSDMVAEPDSNTLIKELCLSMIDASKTELRDTIASDLTKNLVKTHLPLGPNYFQLLLDGKIKKLLFNRYGVPHFDGRRQEIFSGENNNKFNQLPFYEEEDDGVLTSPCLPNSSNNSNNTNSSRVHRLLYPGSFNPLHYGHTLLAQVAQNVVSRAKNDGKPVVLTFEIAASRVDKETIQTPQHFADIASQFIGSRVVFSAAKLFIDKAKMFPHHGFVVGVDTAERILMPKYYKNESRDEMIRAILEIGECGCYFLVAGRKYGTTGWTGISKVDIPAEISHLFTEITEFDFRVDISSTELRERRQSYEAAASNSSPVMGRSGERISSPFPSCPQTPVMNMENSNNDNNNPNSYNNTNEVLPMEKRAGSWTN